MRRSLAFTPRASSDIEQAYAWYESQRAGLGDEFKTELTRVFELLSDVPESGPIIRRDVRRVLTHRFPYAIIIA